MKKTSIRLWQLFGFAVTALGGTLLHFLYDWAPSVYIAPFSGVNESTWEHMKLLFWPALGYAIIQAFFFRDTKDYWCIKLRGIMVGLISIPVFFYTYNGVIGKSPDFVNIAIFFISAALTYLYENYLFKKGVKICSKRRAITIISIIALAFALFTFITPKIGLFKDPITGTYGV